MYPYTHGQLNPTHPSATHQPAIRSPFVLSEVAVPHDTSPLTLNAHVFYHHPMHHSRHPAQPTTSQPGPTIPVRDPHPIPNSPSTPLERDNFFVADSDTNMRQMRQISALQIPSPAMALSPSATIFRRSPDTNLPRVRQRFPSWPRYNHETMRQLSATKNSPQLRFLSHQLRTLLSPPVFAATKYPGMRQDFRSWLRYNHETGETATPGTATCVRSPRPQPPRHPSKQPSRMSHYSSRRPAVSLPTCGTPTYNRATHWLVNSPIGLSGPPIGPPFPNLLTPQRGR